MWLQSNMLAREHCRNQLGCLWTLSIAIVVANELDCLWTWLFVHSCVTEPSIVVFMWHHHKLTCKLLEHKSRSLKGILVMKDEGDRPLGACLSWLDNRSLAGSGTLVQPPFQNLMSASWDLAVHWLTKEMDVIGKKKDRCMDYYKSDLNAL